MTTERDADRALLTTNIAVQVVLLLVLVVDDALDFMLKLDTALSLDPLPAGGGVRAQADRSPGRPTDRTTERERRRQRVIATVAVIYSPFLLYAAGLEYLLLAAIVYAPGTLLYSWLVASRALRRSAGPRRWRARCWRRRPYSGSYMISTGYLDALSTKCWTGPRPDRPMALMVEGQGRPLMNRARSWWQRPPDRKG